MNELLSLVNAASSPPSYLTRGGEGITRILESITDGFQVINADWRLTYMNPAARRIFAGYRKDPEHIIGAHFWDDLFPDTKQSDSAKQILRAMAERVPVRFETYFARWDCWHSCHFDPLPDGGLANYFQDITERKNAEQALRKSEERFRRYFDLGLIGMAITSPSKGVLHVNDEICRILGYDRTELLHKTWAQMTHPDDLHADVVQFDRVLRGEADGYSLDKRWIRKDGRVIDTTISVSCVRRDDRSVEYFMALLQDVTERKRADAASRESAAMLAEAEEIAHIGSWNWDLRTNLVRWSDEHYRILGLRPEAGPVRAEYGLGFVHPDDRAAIQETLARALDTAQPYEACVRILRSDGTIRVVQSRGRTEYDERGQPIRMVGTLQDITERNRAREAVERAREAAERANLLKDQFLATVSHELRTPLAGILLWSQMLENKTLKAGDEAQATRAIRESAQVQQQLIEDLLDISRMLAGEMRLNAQHVDLRQVVHAAVDIARASAQAKALVIEEALDPRACPMNADPSRLQQVLLNLLNNAMKFTPRDGRISVALRRVDATLEIEVADTGQGIVAEFLPHVFERFRQADAGDARRHGGLGLGLAIARQLVELHGGRLQARSPGKGLGATFTIELPVSDAPSEGVAITSPESSAEAEARFLPSPILRGVRALVVDDDTTTREVVQYLLEQCEATVTAVSSAADALREFAAGLRGRRFDVLLSDVGLPEKSGHELIREIRVLERGAGETTPTPAVALTAYAHGRDRAAALAAGFTAHIPKPVSAAALIRNIAACVGRPTGT